MQEQLKNIRCLALDVDGVLTDGSVYLTNQGDEIKAFNIKDGLGVKRLLDQGITVAIITGRQSELVEKRMNELGVTHVYQNCRDKLKTLDALLEQLSITREQVAYMGDDLPDLPVIEAVGLGIAVQDAVKAVKSKADLITALPGGKGAVREISDAILDA